MAGKIIADTIQTEASFLQLNVASNLIATMNANGIFSTTGTKMIGTDGTIGVATVNGSSLVDNTVTAAKIVSVANTQITGLITTSQLANNLTVNASSIISSANIDFKVGASQNTSFRIEDTGQLYNSIESTTGTDYRSTLYAGYMCRAWVNFDGTNTVAIRTSGNVSSISDQGTGQYYVNFTTAMPDDDFATFALANYVPGSGIGTTVFLDNTPLTTRTSLIVTAALNSNYSVRDCTDVSVAIFR